MAIGIIILGAGLMLLRPSLIALAIPFVAYSGIRVYLELGLDTPGLVIERTTSRHRMAEGDELEVSLTCALQPGEPACHVSLVDDLPKHAKLVSGEIQYLGPLVPGEPATITYCVELPRGFHEFKGIQAMVWSRWGIASHTEFVEHASEVIVHPSTSRLARIDIRPRRTRAFAGPVKANMGGQGMDFFGCRSYVPGDDVRRINWRAFARQNSLIINEYELERIVDISIVVDARMQAHCQLNGESTFDHCARAAGSLSELFLSSGNIVGLLVYGAYLHWVFPGTGRTQQQRILDNLSRAYPEEKAVFEDLRNLPTRLFPAQSQIVLISPLVDQDDVEVVALLVDRGYSVILVCPHATTWEEERVGETATSPLAGRISRMQRELFLDSLVRTGTRIVNWDVLEPLAVAIERDIGHPFERRHR